MAAEDTKPRKRKGAADAAPKPKKQKKAEDTAKPAKASKFADESPESTPSKKSRKRAADVFAEDSAAKEETAKVKKPKKMKKESVEVNGAVDDAVNAGELIPEVMPKSKKASKKQKPAKEPIPEVESDLDAEEVDDEDQTAALLAGFESDEDENDPEADVNFSEVAKVAIDKKTDKQLTKAGKSSSKPGVVYVGRIPHGFFEPQMKAYFSQFGTVTKLRLSRNKKTGASKHYAFVEFASEEVADIVARTMDKYLLFGHILQCKVIPSEQIHENLFDGANRRFKAIPRNKMAGLQMARGAERDQWEKRVKLENKKRTAKNKKLKEEFGYEFTAPALKSVDDVPKVTPALKNGETAQLLIEALEENVEDAANDTVDPKPKKAKKAKKPAKSDVRELEENVEDAANDTIDLKAKKARKAKKSAKSDVEAVEENVEGATNEVVDPKPKKAKKAKKSAKSDVDGDLAVDHAEEVPVVKEKKPKPEVTLAVDSEGTGLLVSEIKVTTKSKKTKDVEVAPAPDVPIKEKKRKQNTTEQDVVKKVKKAKA